jgi:hypothetical protein
MVLDGCSIARSTASSRRHPGVSASPMAFDVRPSWPGPDPATGHPAPSLPAADPAAGHPYIGAVVPAPMPIGPDVAASVRRRRAAFVTSRRRGPVRTARNRPRWRWRAARNGASRRHARWLSARSSGGWVGAAVRPWRRWRGLCERFQRFDARQQARSGDGEALQVCASIHRAPLIACRDDGYARSVTGVWRNGSHPASGEMPMSSGLGSYRPRAFAAHEIYLVPPHLCRA